MGHSQVMVSLVLENFDKVHHYCNSVPVSLGFIYLYKISVCILLVSPCVQFLT